MEISLIDAVHNRTRTLKEEFKSVNDELEEDEDLRNNLKYDHKISDEQITANNAKISQESARVAEHTDEIDMLEEDIAASKSKLSDATATRRKVVGGISGGQQSKNKGHREFFRSTSRILRDNNSKRRSYRSKEHQTYHDAQLHDEGLLRVCPAACQSAR